MCVRACVCVCMYITAQFQKEEIIPNSLIQISIGSKMLTFNLVSLNRNFTWGVPFLRYGEQQEHLSVYHSTNVQSLKKKYCQ